MALSFPKRAYKSFIHSFPILLLFFIAFLTGSDKIPVSGFKSLKVGTHLFLSAMKNYEIFTIDGVNELLQKL